MSEGKTEASIYQQAEDGKTELSLMHFAITNPQWQPPRETTHFISQLKERVHREATGSSSDTHPLSLSEFEVWGKMLYQQSRKYISSRFLSGGLICCCFLLLSAKKPHCEPSRWSLNAGIHSFLQGQLSDQSHSSWHSWWGICTTLSVPTYKQCPAKGESECSSQACWPLFLHEQNNDWLWVGNAFFSSSDESKVYNQVLLLNLVSVIICIHC